MNSTDRQIQYYGNKSDDDLIECHRTSSRELHRWMKHKPKNDAIWNVISEIQDDLYFIHEEALRRGIDFGSE